MEASNITLGKYVPYNSIIHRLDPRGKLVAMIIFMVTIFLRFASVWMNFFVYGVLFIILLVVMMIAHIRFSMLFKQLKAMWMMVLILLIINVLVPGDESMGMFTFPNGWNLYYSSIYNTVYIVIRLIMMLGVSLVLTATTKPLEITNALEWFMRPLKVIRFPVHEIAMTISLALRFIPTLLEETERIMKAQASRGVDFEHGKFKEKIRAIISLIIPLFISAFQRSGELADAMEARGYNPSAKRTKFRISKWHVRDTIGSLLVLALLGGLITLKVMNIDVIALLIDVMKSWGWF
jgi:energy-coupling factor transport system permease protein